VPAWKLDKVFRVQTHVNGELRQDATIEELIFSIPTLIKTLSEGQTLMSGDVLATGTVSGSAAVERGTSVLKLYSRLAWASARNHHYTSSPETQ
jgi:2-keto-4-pentenoate hydratase/2-oxohepta-3-ene-1,7-dioic acid hydratase in catechol pathway